MKRIEYVPTGMVAAPDGQYVLAKDAFELQAKLEKLVQANGKLLERETSMRQELYNAYAMIAILAARITDA